MIYNGVIVYWESEGREFEEIKELKFNEVEIEVFEVEYGKIDSSNIIRIELDLA